MTKKNEKKTTTEQRLFYPDSWQASGILSILNWHGCVMCQYPVSYQAFPQSNKTQYIFTSCALVLHIRPPKPPD